jgi:hypothetical protein
VHRVRATNRLLSSLRESEVADLPLTYQVGHGTDDVLDRNARIDAMLVEQIDSIGSQPPKRAFDDVANMPRPAVQPIDGALLIEREAEFRRDHDALARAARLLERPREELLVLEGPVCFGGIEERHTELDGSVNRGDGLSLVAFFGGAVGMAHPHESQAERRHGESLRAQCSCG